MARTIRLVFAAVTLGLGWAMRGHFGHEWGASWAGAMGTLAVLLVSGRKDWIGRAPSLTALGAVGWAAGGMMSYGIVIGYCRSLSFPNTLYGYAMLAVIGGLYGFIGGVRVGLVVPGWKTASPSLATSGSSGRSWHLSSKRNWALNWILYLIPSKALRAGK